MISVVSSPAFSFSKVGSELARVIRGEHFPLGRVGRKVSRDVIILGNPNQVTRRIFRETQARRVVFYLVTEGDVGPDARWLRDELVVVPSHYVRGKLEQSGIKVAGVIPHSVIAAPGPRRKNLKRLLYVANYLPSSYGHRKYPKYGVKAVALSHARVTAVTGPRNPFVGTLNVVPTVHTLSESQLNEIYRQHDLYLNLSDSEGFGLTVLEAMAHGLVVITPEYAPITEITRRSFAIYSPVGGIWHEPYNSRGSGDIEHRYYSPEGMAAAIAEGIRLDDSEYSRMSEEGWREARKYPPENYLKFSGFFSGG